MLLRPSLFRSLRTFTSARINYSSNPSQFVFFLDNMAVCWHPEQKFPYECSKPLPKAIPPPESIFKVTNEEVNKLWTPPEKREIVAEELARKTYTTKHIWFRRARDKRAKKTTPDRPYL